MAFSEMKLSRPSREQRQISGLNPNVAMVMCQSFEGMKVWAFSPVGSSPDGPLLSQKIKVRCASTAEGNQPLCPFSICGFKLHGDQGAGNRRSTALTR
jgi:hypothetical protein